MRVLLDGTPLLGQPTGVGRYAAGLAGALPAALEPADQVAVTAFTWRGRADLAAAAPGTLTVRGRRAPARGLHWAWQHSELPPVEWLAGTADVVHATNFILPPLRRARGVVTIHDLTYLRYPQWVSPVTLQLRELVPRSMRRAAVVCTVSETMRREILDNYPQLTPDRVVVTPNGVDPLFFRAAPLSQQERMELDLPPEYVLAVGTREPRKGLDVLRRVWARSAPSELPPLVLVGARGWGREPQWDSLPDRVIRTGYLASDQVAGVLAGARLLLFPTRYEGFGIPVLEAFAAGTPVVCTDLPVLREIAGGVASFAADDDADAWHAAVVAAVSSQDGELARETRRAHAARFTWAECARRTVRAYRQALR